MHTRFRQRRPPRSWVGRVVGSGMRAAPAMHLFLVIAAFACSATGTTVLAQGVGHPGPSFELTDHTGKPFSSSTLAGHPYVLFFGFTRCPDVCPTTLLEMSNVLKRLGEDADRLKILFVTVDPEQDTPEQLGKYLASFDPRIVGLTGNDEKIAEVAKGWKAFYNKITEDDGSYTIVHSAYVYLVDRENRLFDTLNFQETEEEQMTKLNALVSMAPGSSRK